MAEFRALLIPISLLLMTVAGCSGGSHALPGKQTPAGSRSTATDPERVLNVYNWADYIAPSVIPAFEREYGIKVNYDVFDSNEVLETKLLTGRTSYDVVVPTAYFIENQIKAGVYQKLDKARLPNLHNVDPEVSRATASYDPGNQYAVDYMWLSTTGIGYNITKINARMADAPLKSWRMVFDPTVVSRFQDCGVALIDSPVNIVSTVLIFLGRDPNSEAPEDLTAAEHVLLSVRRYIRYVETARIAEGLANGKICLAIGWSGDVTQARDRAREAAKGLELAFSIPEEGAVSNLDVLAIPAGAPHPLNAHLFIDYLLRPEVAADNSNLIKYANSVATSTALLSEGVRNDPAVYPPADVRAKLVPSRAKSPQFTRLLMRTWTRFKTGA